MLDFLILAVTCFMIGYTAIKSRDFLVLLFMAVFLVCFITNPRSTLSKMKELFDIAACIMTIVITFVSGVIVGSKSRDHWEIDNKQTAENPEETALKSETKEKQS